MASPNADREKRKSYPYPGGNGGRVALILAGLFVAFLILAAIFGLPQGEDTDLQTSGPAEDARPVGAGTNPDGIADENIEGLENETATEDFVDPGDAETDATPNPLLESGDADAPTETSIDDLEPGEGTAEGVLDEMDPEADSVEDSQ